MVKCCVNVHCYCYYWWDLGLSSEMILVSSREHFRPHQPAVAFEDSWTFCCWRSQSRTQPGWSPLRFIIMFCAVKLLFKQYRLAIAATYNIYNWFMLTSTCAADQYKQPWFCCVLGDLEQTSHQCMWTSLVTSLVLFLHRGEEHRWLWLSRFSALSCVPVSNPSRQACTANLFQHQVSGSGTDMHITLRLGILMLTFNKSYLGNKLRCMRERGERKGEWESFLLVIFELERVHVYLAQAINLNLPEPFALKCECQK